MKYHLSVILLPALLAGVLFSGGLTAQTVCRGTVRDAFDKHVIENVNIILEGEHTGTTSDADGNFAIRVPASGSCTLKLSHVSYIDREIVVSAGTDNGIRQFYLTPVMIEIDPVTVTATLNRRNISTLPGRVALVSSKDAVMIPANNTDDLLQGIANVHINRPWGIFSKGASVSMRGLPGSARTLILLDGVPMNKVAGGTVNWNFIQAGDIDNVEIVKGPGSALFGNNAMGGVINMTSKKPTRKIEGKARLLGGSMGTYGGSIALGGADKKQGKGYYWDGSAFYRTGDGYYIEPEESRTENDAKVGLKEYNFGLEGGYSFDSNNTAGLQYKYYNGTFKTGTQIFEEDGSYDQYRSHLILGNYNGTLGKYSLQARVYYQLENFTRQNESMNSSGKYKLSDTETQKNDYGVWLNASRQLSAKHRVTAGMEVKHGDMDALQEYRTSTDEVNYGGQLTFAGLFAQDEYNITKKLSAIAGLRFDYASFREGFQDVENPTSNTGFLQDSSMVFSNTDWMQLSPKLALQYSFNDKVSMYASAATGFMPPKIDDLTKSGKISKGFKLADPDLKPETLINYEAGLNWKPVSRLSFEPSLYYSRGYDFQYFVATGDSVDTGGTDLKPVLQRQNVTDVEVLGAEITAKWEIIPGILLTASYAINESEILSFSDPYNEDKDLTGNALIEVPADKAYASINWRNRIVNVYFDWMYTGDEWYDDENTQYIPAYHVFSVKVNKTLKQGLGMSLSVDNIFDNVTLDRKGMQTPGRFVMAEVSYVF